MSTLDNIITERLNRRVRRQLGSIVRILESQAESADGENPLIIRELRYAARIWQSQLNRYFAETGDFSDFDLAQLNGLLNYLPPDRIFLRYDLERLTRTYDNICLDVQSETAELFVQGEAACDRGDYDIGLNILEHVTRMERRYFPALLVLGHGLIVYRRDTAEAVTRLENALACLPKGFEQHYRSLVLELIAKAYEVEKNYGKARNALLKMLGEALDSPAIRYRIARFAALNGAQNDAMTSLETILDYRPDFLVLALADKVFANISETLKHSLVELGELWGRHTRNSLEKLDMIIELARIYGITERSTEVGAALETINSLKKTVETDGCYSLFQDVILKEIPGLLAELSARVIEQLETLADERHLVITRYNRHLFELSRKLRARLQWLTATGWLALSLGLVILLVNSGISPLPAVLYAVGMLPLGFIPYAIIEDRAKKRYARQRIGIDAVNQVRQHQREIEKIKSEILGTLSH